MSSSANSPPAASPELNVFNLRHRHQKVREHGIQERIRLAQMRTFQRQLAVEFRRVAREVAKDYSPKHVQEVIEQHKRVLTFLLRNQYRRVIETFSKRFHQYAKSASVTLTTKETGDDVFQQRINEYIDKYSAQRVTNISDTTKDKIAEAVREALTPDEDGYVATGDALRRDIEDILADDADTNGRAAMIARTETHGASQDAQFDAAQTLGPDVTKEWVSVEDSRTREDHDIANGQEKEMHEPFEVGDDELMFPGDPSGSAEQVINCRCIAVYNNAG